MGKSTTISAHLKDEGEGNPAVFASGVIAPGETTEVVIGMYEDSMPEPVIALAPESKELEASLVRQQDKGDYTLIYRLANHGQMPLDVAVCSAS